MFKRAYIPRTLNEVKNYERDMDIMMKLKEEDMAMNAQQDNVSSWVYMEQTFTKNATVPNLQSRMLASNLVRWLIALTCPLCALDVKEILRCL